MKIISDKSLNLKPVRDRYIGYGIALVALTILHLLVVDLLSIKEITPDLLIILCVWISIVEGQFTGLFAGFIIGLFFDYITNSIIGTNAFAKTIVGFIAGFFYREGRHDQIIRSYLFILIVFISSMAHNFMFYLFYLIPGQMHFIPFFLKYGIANSIYTSFFAIFAILFKIPKDKLKFLKRND